MARPMSLMIEGWMPSVGSSSNSSFGRITSARPIANCCCLPPARQVAAATAEHRIQHRKQREHIIRNIAVVALQRPETGLEIFLHRQQRENLAALRHEADAAPRPLIGV